MGCPYMLMYWRVFRHTNFTLLVVCMYVCMYVYIYIHYIAIISYYIPLYCILIAYSTQYHLFISVLTWFCCKLEVPVYLFFTLCYLPISQYIRYPSIQVYYVPFVAISYAAWWFTPGVLRRVGTPQS